MARYAALLRAINVGGRNKVRMADLRDTLTDAGYDDVATYIQSGNVVLRSDRPPTDIEDHLAATLADRFGFEIPVAIRSHTQLRDVVEQAPSGFGDDLDAYRCDVLFLRGGLAPSAVMALVDPRDGVDEMWAGTGVVYFRRLDARRSQSRMNRVVGTPEYRLMTIRNWQTTTTLLRMLDDIAG